jgi:excisionase family DNA binding protein
MSKQTVLKPADVRELFNISASKLYYLTKRGIIPGFKVGNEWRYSLADINTYIAKQRAIVAGGAA